jgi:hypothetical protein
MEKKSKVSPRSKNTSRAVSPIDKDSIEKDAREKAKNVKFTNSTKGGHETPAEERKRRSLLDEIREKE